MGIKNSCTRSRHKSTQSNRIRKGAFPSTDSNYRHLELVDFRKPAPPEAAAVDADLSHKPRFRITAKKALRLNEKTCASRGWNRVQALAMHGQDEASLAEWKSAITDEGVAAEPYEAASEETDIE